MLARAGPLMSSTGKEQVRLILIIICIRFPEASVTFFFQGGSSKFALVQKLGGGLLWDRQIDGTNRKKGFFFIEGNPRYNLTDNFFVGVSMYGLFAKDLRLMGFCNGLSVGVRF